MAFFDLPLAELERYLPARNEAADFDAFWQDSLAQARRFPLAPRFERVTNYMKSIEAYDVTYAGYEGQDIKGWLLLPAGRSGPVPCVVEYIGYGGGRGLPTDWLTWASAGYAHLVMDTRGQGSAWSSGDTADLPVEGANPFFPGFMTQGILDPKTYYYRRVFIDAVRAVETARSHEAIDASRIAVTGGSQGGGITLAVSGLVGDLDAVMPDVPFLCHYRRATEIVNTMPYGEISKYLQTHRDHVEQVFQTLSYFDGVNFSARANAATLFSVGLMDETCPPSTVYAAFNHYGGPKEMRVWHYNYHEGGANFQTREKLAFLTGRWG